MSDKTQGLTIEGSAIEALMVKAILEAWSEEQRNALISDAVSTLLNESSSSTFGRNKTVIEVALAKGAEDAAKRVVAELLTQEPYAQRLEVLIKDEFEKLFLDPEDGKGPIRQGIAHGLREKLTGSRY